MQRNTLKVWRGTVCVPTSISVDSEFVCMHVSFVLCVFALSASLCISSVRTERVQRVLHTHPLTEQNVPTVSDTALITDEAQRAWQQALVRLNSAESNNNNNVCDYLHECYVLMGMCCCSIHGCASFCFRICVYMCALRIRIALSPGVCRMGLVCVFTVCTHVALRVAD